MNPISWFVKQIKSIFSFLINDIKQDINTVKLANKRLKQGKPLFNERVKRELKQYAKEFTIGEFLKENWIGILFFILCIVVGWFLASQYYQGQCNTIIHEIISEAQAKNMHINPSKLDISKFNFTQ